MIATPHRKHSEGSLVQRKYFEQMKDTLVDRMIVEAHSDHARAELVRATGICDDELLQELAELGFVKHTLVTLRLTVAAASGAFLGFGRVSAKEKETIEAMVKTLRVCASNA